MQTLRLLCADFARDRRGATAIEYGLVATLVCLAIIAGATQIGASVTSILQKAASNLKP